MTNPPPVAWRTPDNPFSSHCSVDWPDLTANSCLVLLSEREREGGVVWWQTARVQRDLTGSAVHTSGQWTIMVIYSVISGGVIRANISLRSLGTDVGVRSPASNCSFATTGRTGRTGPPTLLFYHYPLLLLVTWSPPPPPPPPPIPPPVQCHASSVIGKLWPEGGTSNYQGGWNL